MKTLQHSPVYSPDVQLQSLQGVSGNFWVVRDDLLEGGTKERAIFPYLQELHHRGFTEFVYASPFCGYAQVALSAACKKLGLAARIYAAEDPKQPGKHSPHIYTQKAQQLGAAIEMVENLAKATAHADEYSLSHPESHTLPLGFDCERYRFYLSEQLTIQFHVIRSQTEKPKNIWIPVGSGTLAQTFDQILPKDLRLNCVNVRVLEDEDSRMNVVQSLPRSRFWKAPERFEESALIAPPIPSNTHYDAKLWRFVYNYAEPGDIWWNVGP